MAGLPFGAVVAAEELFREEIELLELGRKVESKIDEAAVSKARFSALPTAYAIVSSSGRLFGSRSRLHYSASCDARRKSKHFSRLRKVRSEPLILHSDGPLKFCRFSP